MNVVVNFVISDTFADYIPCNKSMGGDRPNLGTEFVYTVDSIKKAVSLANKLIHLTTGERETVFNYDVIKECKGVRQSWSNGIGTHHCEILFNGEWTHYTTATKRGIV
jgi:hypothetical protein